MSKTVHHIILFLWLDTLLKQNVERKKEKLKVEIATPSESSNTGHSSFMAMLCPANMFFSFLGFPLNCISSIHLMDALHKANGDCVQSAYII